MMMCVGWCSLYCLHAFSWKWHWLFQGGGGDGSVLKPSDPVSTCYQMHVSFLFGEVERVSLYSRIKDFAFQLLLQEYHLNQWDMESPWRENCYDSPSKLKTCLEKKTLAVSWLPYIFLDFLIEKGRISKIVAGILQVSYLTSPHLT